MYNLGQFREITKDLSDDFEIKIEACFTPNGNKFAPVFEIITSQDAKLVAILPETVFVQAAEGEPGITISHKK